MDFAKIFSSDSSLEAVDLITQEKLISFDF